ncbi:hypothetical protein GWG65_03490 [Bradyrhizobium sp. CSA207]|uniref:hypothetical protein n=1 Tax=Bradyrhizobium sp. CSA207 TaxID=2698826 RepID=UPI0023B00CC3|nr:hypothetical protein [Bradyrhizobium sp. CSA207]MDE5440527.1 hypothetical protein [Bradyrhizobium sp. CSA207]
MHRSIQKARETLERTASLEAEFENWAAAHAEELAEIDERLVQRDERRREEVLAESRARHERSQSQQPKADAGWNRWFAASFDSRIKSVVVAILKKVAAVSKSHTAQITGLRNEIAELRGEIADLRSIKTYRGGTSRMATAIERRKERRNGFSRLA